jgi:hypothetical protein
LQRVSVAFLGGCAAAHECASKRFANGKTLPQRNSFLLRRMKSGSRENSVFTGTGDIIEAFTMEQIEV